MKQKAVADVFNYIEGVFDLVGVIKNAVENRRIHLEY